MAVRERALPPSGSSVSLSACVTARGGPRAVPCEARAHLPRNEAAIHASRPISCRGQRRENCGSGAAGQAGPSETSRRHASAAAPGAARAARGRPGGLAAGTFVNRGTLIRPAVASRGQSSSSPRRQPIMVCPGMRRPHTHMTHTHTHTQRANEENAPAWLTAWLAQYDSVSIVRVSLCKIGLGQAICPALQAADRPLAKKGFSSCLVNRTQHRTLSSRPPPNAMLICLANHTSRSTPPRTGPSSSR